MNTLPKAETLEIERIPLARPALGNSELAALQHVFSGGWLGQGEEVRRFEKRVRNFLAVPHFLTVRTGTDALHLALITAGVTSGDEVILPSLTFVGCAQAVLMCGAKPVFAEVDPETLLISVEDVARRIGRKTRAIMPVHFAGQAADMSVLIGLADANKLIVVDDAAHAFSSTYSDGVPIGGRGHLSCFSFDPIKCLTCGEGGGIATHSSEWAERLSSLRNLGFDADAWTRQNRQLEEGIRYDIRSIGYRAHLSNINAAIGISQFEQLPGLVVNRKKAARFYDEQFRNSPGFSLLPLANENVTPFMYVLRVLNGRRAQFRKHMDRCGIETGIHYPPIHRFTAFKNYASQLPKTEQVCSEIVSIPLFPSLTQKQLDRIADCVIAFE